MSDSGCALFEPLEKLQKSLGECFEFFTREREARVRAETISRQKDEDLLIVAHELRNSMNVIAGWLASLQAGKLNKPAAERAIESIDRGVKRQVKIIDDLLDAPGITGGKLRLELREIEVDRFLEGVLSDFKILAAAKRIRLEAVFAPHLGKLTADPQRLDQVLCNLLANAVKFTQPGGKIRIAAARRELHLEITISDTGQGIDSKFLPFVFEPFRKAENSKWEGLGLGLSIVRRMIDLHGGSIEAESAGCGKGAVFTIRLPADPNALTKTNQHFPQNRTASERFETVTAGGINEIADKSFEVRKRIDMAERIASPIEHTWRERGKRDMPLGEQLRPDNDL
ncbi:MAG TPA: HAMP domain-containing sensor histidine kinase [Pyrinomonadaceae bacterium]|jgi:signal transduction histidine kinase